VNGKHRDMDGEGEKAMDTNMGGSPGYLSQSQRMETHLVRKWRDIGHQRAVGPRIYNTLEDRPIATCHCFTNIVLI